MMIKALSNDDDSNADKKEFNFPNADAVKESPKKKNKHSTLNNDDSSNADKKEANFPNAEANKESPKEKMTNDDDEDDDAYPYW